MFEEKLKEFEPIFYPKSIAVVGASPNGNKSGSHRVKGLISVGFPGAVYPVGNDEGTIEGLDIFPNLRQVPGEIDYVIVCVPRESVLDVLDDCAAKKVKAVYFFTAGFSELRDEGRELEERMLMKARQGGFRIIGPNCMGVYCPESKIPYGFDIGVSGSAGFVSQSGGICGKLIDTGKLRHIKYSKGISFGNGIDLDASDFLQYLAADPKTSVIGAYLEGTRDGHRLFDTIKEVAKSKPVVVWKGGRTEAGAQAAMSHTGSLKSSAAIWSAMLKQAGAIEVHRFEELSDILLIFQQLGCRKDNNIAAICGVGGGGGGISVSAGDICMESGLKLPPLSSKTRVELIKLLGEVGGILCNPVDISQWWKYGLPHLFQALELVLEDPVIDFLLIQEDVGTLLPFLSWEELKEINDFFIEIRNKQSKPLVIVSSPGSAELKRLTIEEMLLEASIPVFPSMERAAKAIAAVNKYCSSASR